VDNRAGAAHGRIFRRTGAQAHPFSIPKYGGALTLERKFEGCRYSRRRSESWLRYPLPGGVSAALAMQVLSESGVARRRDRNRKRRRLRVTRPVIRPVTPGRVRSRERTYATSSLRAGAGWGCLQATGNVRGRRENRSRLLQL